MTMDRQPISSEELQELLEALKESYLTGDIDDTEARKNLAKMGNNATEIDTIIAEWLQSTGK